ncbi:hypothetical protein BC828DRAFT_376109 [Blastocladiella britannica]|nr:hypothetical protein BC828DRAFT_376109 [Blastocladiella britannica]
MTSKLTETFVRTDSARVPAQGNGGTPRRRPPATNSDSTTLNDDEYDEDERTSLLDARRTTPVAPLSDEDRDRRRYQRRTEGRHSQRAEFYTPVPWRALALTVFLLAFAGIALTTSVMLFTGRWHTTDPDKYKALAVLGTLCGIPGAYYGTMFLMVGLGVRGWDLEGVPDL